MFRTISHYRTQTQVLFAVTVAATVFIIQITASVVSSLEEDIQDHQHSVAKVKRQSKSSLRCPKPNGLFPYEEDCSKFLNCAHGRPYLQSCGPGTVFNPEILVCDFPWNVYCVNDRDITSDKHYGNKRGYDGQYTEHKVDHSISHADRHDDHQRPDHSIKNLNRHTEQDTEHRKPGSLSPEREILHLGQENQHSWKDSQQKGHINPLLGSDDQEIGQNAGELGFGIQQLEDDDHEPEKSRVPSVSHINRLKPTKPSSTRYQPTKQSSNQDKLNEPSTDQEQTEEPLLWKNVKKIVAKAGTKIKKKWRKLFSKVEDKNNEIATGVIQALNSTYLQVKKTVEEETKKLLKDDSEPQNLCLKPDGLFPYPKVQY